MCSSDLKHRHSKHFTIYKSFNQVNTSLSKFFKNIEAKIKSLGIYLIIRIHHVLTILSILLRPKTFEASLSAFIIPFCIVLYMKMKNENKRIYPIVINFIYSFTSILVYHLHFYYKNDFSKYIATVHVILP